VHASFLDNLPSTAPLSGQILAGPQPQALEPLKGRFAGSRQHRAMDRADLRGGYFVSG